MNVYTFLSHTKTFLPYQCRAMKRQVRGCRLIVIEDGLRLTAAEREAWGVDEVLAAPVMASIGFARHWLLYRWAVQNSRGTALIVHGDVFPLRPIDGDTLLGGKQAAGTGKSRDGRTIYHFRWLALTEQGRRLYDAASYRWPDAACRHWDWTHDMAEAAVHCPRLAACEALGMEWCPPALLHMNHMTRVVSAEKLALLEELFGPVPQVGSALPIETPNVARQAAFRGEVLRRMEICRGCVDRPAGCWRAVEYGCQRKYREAGRRAAERADCPLGKLS